MKQRRLNEMNKTEQLIIDVALYLFSEKGYAATSIRDIASGTCLTSSTLYYYVDSKKKLLFKIMNKYLRDLIKGAEEALTCKKMPVEKLENLIWVHVMFHGKQQIPALVVDTEYRSLEGSEREEIGILRKKYEKMWQEILSHGFEEKYFIFDNAKTTSYALLEMCTGVAHWYRQDRQFSIEEIAKQYQNLGLNMVGFNSKK